MLGVLLVGIVALNVVTLSLAATAGKIDENIQTLGQENSVLRSRTRSASANGRVRTAAASSASPSRRPSEITYRDAGPDAVAAAARSALGPRRSRQGARCA